MQRYLFLVCFLFSFQNPLFAAGEELHLRNDVPFREDSGLTKAEYFIATEKYAEALEEIALALKRHPQSADAWTYRGYAFYRLGDNGKAREALRKALLIAPTHLGANKYMANLYLEEGKLPQALEQMQVIRMTCGATDCEELNELQRDINKYKIGKLGTE